MTRRLARLTVALAAAAMTAASLVALSGPAAAYEAIWPASGSIAVTGHGYGHGHGLSQYGAQGASTRGATAAQILSFYYPGTAAGTMGAGPIRVHLSTSGGPVIVSSRTGLYMRDATTGALLALSTSYSHWRIGYSTSSGYLLQYLSASRWNNYRASPQPMGFTGPSTNRLWFTSSSTVDFTNVRSTAYRGELRLLRTGTSTFITVNLVDMDLYLRGVVPRESPSSWPAAALQAQAVAARSYSAYKRDHASAQPFDVYDTTQDQVYGGYSTYSDAASVGTFLEQPTTTSAVIATANQVRSYGGRPIFAQFSSSNGGFTSAGSQPYLRAAADPWERYSSNPYMTWTTSVTPSSLRSLAGLKTLSRIYVFRETTAGGHVTLVRFIGTDSANSTVTVDRTGDDLRRYFGWRSSYFGFVTTGATDGGPTGSWPLVGDQIFAYQGSARVINGVSDAQAGYRPYITAIQREAAVAQTGRYDWATVTAVARWQGLVGLPKTGITDATTWQPMTVR